MSAVSSSEATPDVATPTRDQQDYLNLLSHHYPTIGQASAEIVRLRANLELPKGTEHFITDLHGEHEPFEHVLRNGSGSIKRRIDETFRDEPGKRLNDFCPKGDFIDDLRK